MSNHSLLKLVLIPAQSGAASSQEEKQYATIRFPDSYQMAIDSALKAFSRHLPENSVPKNFEMLHPVIDEEGTLAWSVFDPADWNLILEAAAGKMLGVRDLRSKIATSDQSLDSEPEHDEPFLVGSVAVSYGTFKEGTTKWSFVGGRGMDRHPSINRPSSYREAIESISSICPLPDENRRVSGFPSRTTITGLDFKFHTFAGQDRNGEVTTAIWIDMPDAAYTNDVIWRRVVSKPFEILGFTLHEPNKSVRGSHGDGNGN